MQTEASVRSTSPASSITPDLPPLTVESLREASELPIGTRFELERSITPVQRAFLEVNGFLVFNGVARPDEVTGILGELERIEREWLADGRDSVFGIPLFKGRAPDGAPFLQRFPFTSCFSDYIKNFVRDPRFLPVRSLIGKNTRVGDQEKDGVVINRYINRPGSVYPKLGWHTDGLRDLFYLKMPKQMLNVGLHFDRIKSEDGGLRLIPGTHNQGFWSMCFKKPYFISHGSDPLEIAVETEPGDLTVHDGRLWHRVQASPHSGMRSLRRSMYVPYLTDEFTPKGVDSGTPFYHYLGKALRKLQLMKS